jgi:prophage DNA circulation protein
MAADQTAVLSWLTEMVADVVTDAIDKRDLTRRIAVARSRTVKEFAPEILSIARVIGDSVVSLTDFDRISIPVAADGETRDAMAIVEALALSIAGAKIDWPSRPAARAARSRIAAAGDIALAVASRLRSPELYAWLAAVVSISVRVVSDIAANSVPVVRVETEMSLPSTLLAYRLYSDASRAAGVVEIARSATPLLMPSAFDALAS